MTVHSETLEGKDRTNKKEWKKDYRKERIWIGEKGNAEKIEKDADANQGDKKGKMLEKYGKQ